MTRTEGVPGVYTRRTTPDTSETISVTFEMLHLTLEVFNAYALAVEATIKGSIAVQNAMFAAGKSVLDAGTNSSRNVARQWTEIAREAQQATLELWQAGVGAGDKMLVSAASGEMAGQEDVRA